MQVTTQQEEIGESKQEELAEEEPVAVAKAVKSSTIGKWKRKAAPARAKVYTEVEGPVSDLTSHHQHALTHLLTVRPMPDTEVKANLHHQPVQVALQEVPDGQELVLLEGV
jgi:hypothetical protein